MRGEWAVGKIPSGYPAPPPSDFVLLGAFSADLLNRGVRISAVNLRFAPHCDGMSWDLLFFDVSLKTTDLMFRQDCSPRRTPIYSFDSYPLGRGLRWSTFARGSGTNLRSRAVRYPGPGTSKTSLRVAWIRSGELAFNFAEIRVSAPAVDGLMPVYSSTYRRPWQFGFMRILPHHPVRDRWLTQINGIFADEISVPVEAHSSGSGGVA